MTTLCNNTVYNTLLIYVVTQDFMNTFVGCTYVVSWPIQTNRSSIYDITVPVINLLW